MSSKENLTEVPLDTLILHQFPRTQMGPSLSPFALKMETYLRLAKITYANDFSQPTAKKTGKCPWITYKGQDLADSSFCIEFLKNSTGVDLNAALSSTDKAISRAFQKLIEEELFWVIALWRFVYDKSETLVKSMQAGKIKSFVVSTVFGRGVKKATHGHGIGRHTEAEVMLIGENDIRAVGEFLGSKKYLMGEAVSDVDCTVFGFFAQLMYSSPTCPLTAFVKENYPNIVEYCERIKAEVWPDWEDIAAAAKIVEKEKKSVKKTVSVDTNGVTNGGHVEEQVNDTTAEGQTIVVVKETEHFVPTAHGDILVQEIESTKTVVTNGGEHVAGKENGHSNGYHHHQETNGHQEVTTTTATTNGGTTTTHETRTEVLSTV